MSDGHRGHYHSYLIRLTPTKLLGHCPGPWLFCIALLLFGLIILMDYVWGNRYPYPQHCLLHNFLMGKTFALGSGLWFCACTCLATTK